MLRGSHGISLTKMLERVYLLEAGTPAFIGRAVEISLSYLTAKVVLTRWDFISLTKPLALWVYREAPSATRYRRLSKCRFTLDCLLCLASAVYSVTLSNWWVVESFWRNWNCSEMMVFWLSRNVINLLWNRCSTNFPKHGRRVIGLYVFLQLKGLRLAWGFNWDDYCMFPYVRKVVVFEDFVDDGDKVTGVVGRKTF